MSSCSRILKNPWLLAVLGLWSLLAFFLVTPFTAHASAIAPMEKTSHVDDSQHLSITIHNHTNSLMKLIGSSLAGSKWGKAPTDVKPQSDLTFDVLGVGNSPSGTPGWVTWRLSDYPKTPTVSILLNDPSTGGNGDGIISNPPDAVQFSSNMLENDSDIQENFTIRSEN